MDIGGFISSVKAFDLLVFFFLFAFFIAGFMQGILRRLLGIASILFSFFVAAQLRDPLGNFLAANWTQFPDAYSRMIGFGAVFAAATIAFSLAIQTFYRPTPLFARYPSLDEVVGGVLGVIEGAILIGAIIMITDPFFQIPGIPHSTSELPLLRPLHDALNDSVTAHIYRTELIPAFLAVFGVLIPDGVKAVFPASGH